VRAGVYVRISRDTAGEGLGVQRQESDCRDLAARLGWDVGELYVDNDLSASSGVRRPAYLRMLDDMAHGRISAVIAWHPDRLTRRPAELEQLIMLADDKGVKFSTCRSGEIDLSTSSGRLVARLLGAVARHEVELKGERQSAKMRQLAMDGRNTGGGSRPFGWNKDRMTLDRVEAQVIRDLAGMAIAGTTLSGLSRHLMAAEIKTAQGGDAWAAGVLKRMLMNPRLAGLSVYRGEIVGKGTWQPVLDEDTWRRVREALTYRGPARNNRGRVSLFQASIIRCGICGFSLLVARRGVELGKLRVYACRERSVVGRPGYGIACNRIAIKAEALEEDVVEQLLARLIHQRNQPMVRAAKGGSERDGSVAHVRDLADLEDLLKANSVDYADGIITRLEFMAIRSRLVEKIDGARDTLDASETPSVPGLTLDHMMTWWGAAGIEQKQAIVRGHIASVTISSHHGARAVYDYRRVSIEWR